MSDTETPPDSGNRQDSRKSLVIRGVKWTIFVLVMLGLVLAARAAFQQWSSERDRLAAEVVEVEALLAGEVDATRREELEALRSQLESQVPRLGNLRWHLIAVAAVLYGVGLIPPAFLLRRALVSLGQSPSRGTAIAAQLLGHAGKYVPGKAMVIVLRAGALAQEGVRGLPATVSVFLETFLMMAVGAAVAGAIVVWLPVPRWIAGASLCVALCASLPTTPPVLRRVARRIAKDEESAHAERIGWRLFAAGWGWSLLAWLLIGGSFTCLVAAIPGTPEVDSLAEVFPIATAAICLAVVAGFASLIPGGAGVRELVLTTVLGVSVGPVRGILAALAARLLYILVEAVFAGAAWWWLRRKRVSDGSFAHER